MAIIDPSHELRDFIRWEAGLNRKPYTSATALVAHEIGLTACGAEPTCGAARITSAHWGTPAMQPASRDQPLWHFEDIRAPALSSLHRAAEMIENHEGYVMCAARCWGLVERAHHISLIELSRGS